MLSVRKKNIVKSFSIGLVLLFLFFSISRVLPVLAAYIGPDRTVTESVTEGSGWGRECQLVAGSYQWATTTTCNGCLSSCVTRLENQYPDSNPASICNASYVGSKVHDYSCTTVEQEITYQPAEISSSIACADPGNDGWCRSDVTVNLSGSEGADACGKYALALFEDNQANSAPATGCSAAAAFTFTASGSIDYQAWVHSSLGDTSTITNQTVLIDKVPPSLIYTQPDLFSLELAGEDEHSGIDYFEVNINASGWVRGASHTLLPGVNLIDMRVFDRAGNVTAKSTTIITDNTPPETLSDQISPLTPNGRSGWYITAPTITVSAEDSQTGVAFAGIVLDGMDREARSGTSIGEGIHAVEIKAVDGAGNQRVEPPISFGAPLKVDTSDPVIHTAISPAPTAGDWYSAPVILNAASSSDAVSGLDSIEIDLDGAGYVPTSEIELLEGQHIAVIRVNDVAGNRISESFVINVDLTPPYAHPSITGNRGPGVGLPWYRSSVSVLANAGDAAGGPIVVENALNRSAYLPGSQVEVDLQGIHEVTFQVTDPVGRQAVEAIQFGIDLDAPGISITSHGQGEVVAGDVVRLAGTASDVRSGVYQVELKIGDGDWNQYAPDLINGGTGDADWSFDISVANLNSGPVEVSVRAQDQAGNYSQVQTIQIVVSKRAARLEIPARWMVSQTITPRHIKGDTGGVSRAIASISHPSFGIQTFQLRPVNDWAIKWDGYFEAKQVWASPGEYTIVVTSWDQYGNTASDRGLIFVPAYEVATEIVQVILNVRGTVTAWGGGEVAVEGEDYQITSESSLAPGIHTGTLVYGEAKKTYSQEGASPAKILWLKPAVEVPIYGLVEIVEAQALQVDGQHFNITADSKLPDNLMAGMIVSGISLDFGEASPDLIWLEPVTVTPLPFSGTVTAYGADGLLAVDGGEFRITEETVISSTSGLGVGDEVTGWYLEKDENVVSIREIEPDLVSFEGAVFERTDAILIVDEEIYNIVADSVLPDGVSAGHLVTGQAYLFEDGHYELIRAMLIPGELVGVITRVDGPEDNGLFRVEINNSLYFLSEDLVPGRMRPGQEVLAWVEEDGSLSRFRIVQHVPAGLYWLIGLLLLLVLWVLVGRKYKGTIVSVDAEYNLFTLRLTDDIESPKLRTYRYHKGLEKTVWVNRGYMVAGRLILFRARTMRVMSEDKKYCV